MNSILPQSKYALALVLLISMLSSSCGGSSWPVIIKGTIDGGANRTMYLKETTSSGIVTIDSLKTNRHGEFDITLQAKEPRFILLDLQGAAEPIIFLVEADEHITLNASVENFARSYSVIGSKGSILVRNMNRRLNRTVAAIDSLSLLFRQSREQANFDSLKRTIDSTYSRAVQEHREYTVQFVKGNRYSLAAILALYQQYHKNSNVLNKRDDFALFQLVDSTLFPLYPNNPLVANLHSNVSMIKNQLALYEKRKNMLAEGDRVPNLLLPVVNGENIRLYEAKGRYTLIDFWATWCKDCHGNNNNLLEAYRNYFPKGFQVIQVSLDAKKTELLSKLQADSIPWPVVADFEQWESPLMDSLSVNSIPANYLIDRNGIIVERNISHSSLMVVLKKYMP